MICFIHFLHIHLAISSGIYTVIEQIMENFIGDRAKEIEIISNGGGVQDRKWDIKWRDET